LIFAADATDLYRLGIRAERPVARLFLSRDPCHSAAEETRRGTVNSAAPIQSFNSRGIHHLLEAFGSMGADADALCRETGLAPFGCPVHFNMRENGAVLPMPATPCRHKPQNPNCGQFGMVAVPAEDPARSLVELRALTEGRGSESVSISACMGYSYTQLESHRTSLWGQLQVSEPCRRIPVPP
jgi:hypothetical protein